MRRLALIILVLALSACAPSLQSARARFAGTAESLPFRGWHYAASRLTAAGVPETWVQAVFSDPRLPAFTPVPFSLAPKESRHLYSNFTSENSLQRAAECLDQFAPTFEAAEQRFHVSRFTLASLLIIETNCGRIVGKEQVFYRLARLVSSADPLNVEWNWKEKTKQLNKGQKPSLEDFAKRAEYLQRTFLPELVAMFKLSQKGVDVLELRGSSAGAFGIPQFLPTSYMSFAQDGNGDGQISLFEPSDAIFSTANFLSSNGWKENSPLPEREKALWYYNRSAAYGEAVIKVSILLRQLKGSSNRAPATRRA